MTFCRKRLFPVNRLAECFEVFSEKISRQEVYGARFSRLRAEIPGTFSARRVLFGELLIF